MKRMLALVLALVMVISMMPATFVSAQTTDRVADLVTNMSLRDKVTQMMMVDFRKWGETDMTATDFTEMNDEVRKIIEDYNFGSIILFANNIKETAQSYNLVYAMQEAATKDDGLALIICADQEGGSVYRLGSGTALPGNMALGATYAANGTKYAYEAGKIIGSELGILGINGNLAPVVDVNNNANNPVIGLRSYGDDAVMVGELAAASIAGMAEYNVIGCAKHFPGHGDTATDSHYGLPSVDKPLDVLMENELAPYTVAIEEGIEMIMTAHILYPQLESDKILSNKTGKEESLPATMSDDILTGLLKEQMGFEGIIVTDAMNMAGISNNWDQVQSCVIAIQSGVDLICMPTQLYCQADLANLDVIIEGLIAAVEDGTIAMSRIDDAVTRILTVKENRGILDYNPADYSLEAAQAVVGCAANREMERELAAAAVTVIKNDGTLPLDLTENSKVLMMVPYNNERAQMLMAWNRAKEAGLIPEGAEVDYITFSRTSTIESLQEKMDWADTLIINSEISNTTRYNPASSSTYFLYNIPNQICDYAAANGKKAIISSVDKPYDVQMYANANAIVATYGCKGSSVDPTEALIGGATGSAAAYGPNIIAAVEVILGTFAAQGKLPVNIPVLDMETRTFTDEIAYERGYGLTYDAKKPSSPDEPENRALNAEIIAYNGYALDNEDTGPHKLFDGTYNNEDTSKWCEEGADLWVAFDLGTVSNVSSLKIFHAGSNNEWEPSTDSINTVAYELYVLNTEKITVNELLAKSFEERTALLADNTYWIELAAVTDNHDDITFHDVDLANVRIFKFNVSDTDSTSWASCVRVYELEVYGVDGHTHSGEWVITKEATCTEDGSKERTCECGETETLVIPALGHNYEDGTCTNCGKPEDVSEHPFVDVAEGTWFQESVEWAVEKGITNGMDDTHFAPDANAYRAQVVTFLWRAAGCPEPESTNNPFTDVVESDYFYKAVLWAVENNITNGMTPTTFGPHSLCTRAQFVTFLYRTVGAPEVTSTNNPFPDVDANAYYGPAVLWAVEMGITKGMDDGTFGVELNCTRAQIVTFLYRTFQ